MYSAVLAAVILVVEDELLTRMTVAECLADSGYRVFEAANVDEAKAVLKADPKVDLVFTDVQMPGEEDGFDLAIWLRTRDPKVPVILTSGWAGAAKKARDLGHDGPMIPKPYEYAAVLRLVRELLCKAGRSG